MLKKTGGETFVLIVFIFKGMYLNSTSARTMRNDIFAGLKITVRPCAKNTVYSAQDAPNFNATRELP